MAMQCLTAMPWGGGGGGGHLDSCKLGILIEEALDEQLLQGYEVGLLQ